MRQILRSNLPSLADGIYGSADPPRSPGTGAHPPSPGDPNWTWTDAETRLSDVFEREGAEAWMKSAIRELEAESALERRRREDIELSKKAA